MDAETLNAFENVHSKVEAQSRDLVKKMDEGFSKVGEKLDKISEDNHRQDLDILENRGEITTVKAALGRLKQKVQISQDKVWSVARPILTKLLEMAVIGGLLYVFTQVLSKRGG